jgi:ABC-type bacteriocin/lantibiotic exporter with double-glycine peptidase domain
MLGAAPGVDFARTLTLAGGAALLEGAPAEESRLGPGGRALSGGERQWVSLARALATSQPVLLLDEPTSALDPASQRAMLDAIARLRGTRSVILVTHRPEPLALADVVVSLGRGRVVVEARAARGSGVGGVGEG